MKGRHTVSPVSALTTITAIETMERDGLLILWTELFGTVAPARVSQPLLRRFLALELQAPARGGLARDFAGRLGRQVETGARPKAPSLASGSRILREWNGVTHVVDVSGDSLLWNGRRYASLSAIAAEITGAHWSGPRFFGLSGKAAAR
jgi:Protein of unknown function (DUF2924)